MNSHVVKLSNKNQIYLPKNILKELSIEKEDSLRLTVNSKNMSIQITPIKDPIEALRGALKGKGSVQQLLNERKKDNKSL